MRAETRIRFDPAGDDPAGYRSWAATLAGATGPVTDPGGNAPAATGRYTEKTSTTNEGKSIMGERMLRGSRLGAVSYESDRNTELAPRQTREYLCAKGHQFEVPFAVDAEVPTTWECKFDGSVARLVDGTEPEQKKAKPPRTHWDMLLERRSIAELEDILAERLQEVRTRRGRA
ncbi:RNA polymerase-binding protein [Micromonospora coxensis]|nr:RNA polymerase-binding protein [Micromonospora coxensis]